MKNKNPLLCARRKIVSGNPMQISIFVSSLKHINRNSMKKLIDIAWLMAVCLLMGTACHSAKKTETQAEADPSVAEAIKNREFPFPEMPTMLNQPKERKEFLLKHYWDRYPFADTLVLANREITEQGYVNYIALLADGETSPRLQRASLDALCTYLTKHEKACDAFLTLMRDYLYDSNSPQYNEPLYAEFLQSMLRHAAPDDARRSTFSFRLKLIGRNNPGSPASNFTYTLKNGKATSLIQTPVKGSKLIVLFYDPECGHCNQVTESMKADARLANAIKDGKLTLLAVYTEGDEEVWKRSQSEMPARWIVGNDHQQVKDSAFYDLKAMPTLYLLDARKNVLLKDAPYGQICEYLGWKD